MKIKNLLVPFMIGLIGIFAFAPFSFKPLIFISYAYLINILLHEKDSRFLKVISWGLGHWGFGMSWIIVSVYYYGETSILLSSAIFVSLVLILSIVFTCPVLLIKTYLEKLNITSKYTTTLVVSSLLVISELSRYYLLNGVPWLIPGNIYLDTITQNIYPLFGVTAASLLIYIFCTCLVVFYDKKKVFFSIIFILIISLIPNYKSLNEIKDGTMISIIQPSSDPFLKYEKDYYNQIEKNLISMITLASESSEIIVLPEAELPYPIKSNKFSKFLSKIPKSEKLVMGAWDYHNNSVFNTIYSINTMDSYKKTHLVPFGEYIPFFENLRGIIDFFDLPMSNVSHGLKNQPNIKINKDISVASPICFDIAFPNTVRKMNKSSLLMINVSNDTWFGNSIGPYHHLSIARIRSIENNRWTIRATNDGISAIIDNKGTIVDKINKGETGILEAPIDLLKTNSFYNKIGYLFTYIFSFIILLITLSTYIWQKFTSK